MTDRISDSQIRYLFDHLDLFYTGSNLRQYLSTEVQGEQASFIIPLSDRPLTLSGVIHIREIPVLFPCSKQLNWYAAEGKNIRFHHDILKAAFYLLSGYQEVHTTEKDQYGRFPWRSSLQYQLGVTGRPVVNYYFEIILEAFELFCKQNRLEFSRKRKEAPLLFLSHDVDRIHKYSLRNLAYSALQLAGLRPRTCGFSEQLRDLLMYARGLLSFRRDPYQTFEWLCSLEEELHISSTWFFLEKTKMEDSRYSFDEKRIRKLIRDLSQNGHEIGLHGPWESCENEQLMHSSLERLNKVSGIPVAGVRQHFLRYKNPLTPSIQSRCGLRYDSTLGFSEQIGFRNSYAHPFRLYDFDRQEAMDIWQIPLQVMDVTLLEYMDLRAETIQASLEPLLEEVSKFNGVFSLLWHNCRLDETSNPGITAAYEQLLKGIMEKGYASVTGQALVESMQEEN